MQGGYFRVRHAPSKLVAADHRLEPQVPVPSFITHVSEALRGYIHRLEKEAVVGTVRYGTRRVRESGAKQQNRWRMPTDLRRVAPYDGRPTSWSGATSFHFEVTRLSKASNRASKTGDGGARSSGAAGDHERYMSDPEKLEQVLAADFERYLGGYGDEPLNPGAGSRAGLVMSNIGEGLAERQAFWNDVWAHEREPGAHRLEFAPDRATSAEWRGLADDRSTPSPVANAIRDHLLRDHRPRPKRRGPRQPSIVTVEFADPAVLTWASQLGDRFGSSKSERPVHFVEPRGGLVQQRLVAEFPEELDSRRRCAVVRSLAEDLERVAVPFTVVVHAPDHRNDRRNHHLHAIWYPRRCERRADGTWDIANGHKLRPGDVVEALGIDTGKRAASSHWADASADVKLMRVRFADHCNEALARMNINRRLDPRTYEEMGVDQEPAKHLGTAAAALVAAGAYVAKDHENACKSWTARERAAERESAERRNWHRAFLEEMRSILSDDEEAIGPEIRDLLRSYEEQARNVDKERVAMARLLLEREMAESAARRLERGTAQLLGAIERGQGSADDKRNAKLIAARYRLARAHLQEIANAVGLWAEQIEAFRNRVAGAEHDLANVEFGIRDRVAEWCRLRQRQPWRDATILPLDRSPDPLADHGHFNALVKRVREQNRDENQHLARLHLWLDPDGSINIENMNSRDQAVLGNPAFRDRVLAALRPLALRQEQELGRVLVFVERHGLSNLQAGLRASGSPAPPSVISLHAFYAKHPVFLERVSNADKCYRGSMDSKAALKSSTAPSVESLIGQVAAKMEQTTGNLVASIEIVETAPQPIAPVATTGVAKPVGRVDVHVEKAAVKSSPAPSVAGAIGKGAPDLKQPTRELVASNEIVKTAPQSFAPVATMGVAKPVGRIDVHVEIGREQDFVRPLVDEPESSTLANPVTPSAQLAVDEVISNAGLHSPHPVSHNSTEATRSEVDRSVEPVPVDVKSPPEAFGVAVAGPTTGLIVDRDDMSTVSDRGVEQAKSWPTPSSVPSGEQERSVAANSSPAFGANDSSSAPAVKEDVTRPSEQRSEATASRSHQEGDPTFVSGPHRDDSRQADLRRLRVTPSREQEQNSASAGAGSRNANSERTDQPRISGKAALEMARNAARDNISLSRASRVPPVGKTETVTPTAPAASDKASRRSARPTAKCIQAVAIKPLSPARPNRAALVTSAHEAVRQTNDFIKFVASAIEQPTLRMRMVADAIANGRVGLKPDGAGLHVEVTGQVMKDHLDSLLADENAFKVLQALAGKLADLPLIESSLRYRVSAPEDAYFASTGQLCGTWRDR